MSVMIAQIHMMFEKKYLPREDSKKGVSYLSLSEELLQALKYVMVRGKYDKKKSVFDFFRIKLLIMGEIRDLDCMSQQRENVSPKRFWREYLNRIISESMPFSRDGRFRFNSSSKL